METTVVLHDFPKTNVFVTNFFVNSHTVLFVALVTKFKNLS